ncbi:MAG: hypothetical protein RSE34_05265 [Brevundimonas sp.]
MDKWGATTGTQLGAGPRKIVSPAMAGALSDQARTAIIILFFNAILATQISSQSA